MSMYASRASSTGFGGPPAPAHIVSSMKIGPRGMNGASPFMKAQPERDIDSTPPARPTESSSLRIACATWIAHVSDDAQKRFTVAAGTESGKPAASAAQRAMSPIPSWAGFTQPAAMSSIRSCAPRRARRRRSLLPSSWDEIGELRQDLVDEHLHLLRRAVDGPEDEGVEAVGGDLGDRLGPEGGRAGQRLAREVADGELRSRRRGPI